MLNIKAHIDLIFNSRHDKLEEKGSRRSVIV